MIPLTAEPTIRRDEDDDEGEADLEDRLDSLEREQTRLERTVSGLARESNVSIGGSCPHCEEAYMIQRTDSMYCPACRNRTGM
ncbi:hypothetical protein [Natrialba swarupiae]|uniref:CopG family transcriptional regulator n=1 Tax=Natrialba swarupiae TaxID=2448032 RepID=A0A5D5AKB0_9EURY|nr:hypothetical protein [Natrialba swarupiae]TYT61614.1 hypothetical protein FYC77_13085 [Natrialba swarupiae]